MLMVYFAGISQNSNSCQLLKREKQHNFMWFYTFLIGYFVFILVVIMGDTIIKSFHWMQFSIFIVELILAIRISKNENVLPIMRTFYWYPIIGIFVTFIIVFQYYNKVFSDVAFRVNIFSLLFHYLFLSYFILNSIHKMKYFKIIIWILFLCIAILITNNILNKHLDSVAFTNGCLFFFSLFYFFFNLQRGY